MSETKTLQATETPDKIETETCSRCGGSGKYSYCQTHGDKCFKCGGSGRTYTKRGTVAARYLTRLRSKTAAEVVPGDVIYLEGVPGYIAGRWIFVTGIAYGSDPGHRYIVNGEPVPPRPDLLGFDCRRADGVEGVEPERVYRVKQTAEQMASTLAQAVAFQATLTKTGTPRKPAGKKAA